METTNQNFLNLIEVAIALTREGAKEAEKTSTDFADAMRLIATKEARLELRIRFSPLPSVACEIIRDCDGELAGILFEHQSRHAPLN